MSSINRNGTGQASRMLQALDPGYVSPEERTPGELVEVAANYAEKLNFFNLADTPDGNWKRFFDADPSAVEEVLADSERLSDNFENLPEKYRKLATSHFALFMAFLKLLRHPQNQFRQLTKRHLDFYYKKILRMEKKEFVPDRVHIIFSLAAGVDRHPVEKGTLLKAGVDSAGNDFYYETEDDVLVSKAYIHEVKTVFVHKPEIELLSIHRQYAEKLGVIQGFHHILRMVLGWPDLEDNLPSYPDAGETTEDLKACMEVVKKVKNEESTFKPDDWKVAYEHLEKAYKNRINHEHITKLREEHENPDHPDANIALDSLIRLALGDPEPGYPLPVMPAKNLEELFGNVERKVFSAVIYVRKNMHMHEDDFCRIMKTKADKEASEDEWSEIYAILEKAQRKKRNFVYPPMVKKETMGIYRQDIPINNMQNKLKFKTFGSLPQDREETSEKTNVLPGFAASSSILAMEGGKRTIVLMMDCTPGSFNVKHVEEILKKDIFDVFVMSGGKRIEPSEVIIKTGGPSDDDYFGLQFELVFRVSDPPLQLCNAAQVDLPTGNPYPSMVVKIKKMDTESLPDLKHIYYEAFKDIRVKKVRIATRIEGLPNVLMRTPQGVPDAAAKSFNPFGNAPEAGDALFFTHDELCRNTLEKLDLDLDWEERPPNFADHYEPYDVKELNNESFKVQLKMLNRKRWLTPDTPQLLFAQDKDKNLKGRSNVSFGHFTDDPYYSPVHSNDKKTANPVNRDSYFSLELTGDDFLHSRYPDILSSAMQEVANTEAAIRGLETQKISLETQKNFLEAQNASEEIIDKLTNNIEKINKDLAASGTRLEQIKPNLEKLQVNRPHTPSVKRISVNYSAVAEMDLKNEKSGDISVLQLHPFGFRRLSAENTHLLPQYNEEGYIHIGIKDLSPPSVISLLFQMAPGTGDPDSEKPAIRWSYLSGDIWEDFKPSEILCDTTEGMLEPGIIRFNIPVTASSIHTLMPRDMYWIRACVRKNIEAVSEIISILPHSVSAVFKKQKNSREIPNIPLPAGTIKEPGERDPDVKEVIQPYTSFGGSSKESDSKFYMRVSERLRHKQRALAKWDYEHLVLEKFPEVYHAKCLRIGERLGDHKTKEVTMVVTPDISDNSPFFPLEPKAKLSFLNEIKDYLLTITSPFTHIRVKNPCYEQITYRFAVRFKKGFNISYYMDLLNEELKNFLSPWAYKTHDAAIFGNIIRNASVADFIENREYVDYVANLKLFKQVDPEESLSGDYTSEDYTHEITISNKDYAEATRPDAILISSPRHIMDHVYTQYYDPNLYEGVGQMIIGLDFILGFNSEDEDLTVYDYDGVRSKDFRDKGINCMIVGRNLVLFENDGEEPIEDYDGFGFMDFRDKGIDNMIIGRNLVSFNTDMTEAGEDYEGVGTLDFRDKGLGHMIVGRNFVVN